MEKTQKQPKIVNLIQGRSGGDIRSPTMCKFKEMPIHLLGKKVTIHGCESTQESRKCFDSILFEIE
jgi:hypothetical protein